MENAFWKSLWLNTQKKTDLGCLCFFHVLDSFPPWLSIHRSGEDPIGPEEAFGWGLAVVCMSESLGLLQTGWETYCVSQFVVLWSCPWRKNCSASYAEWFGGSSTHNPNASFCCETSALRPALAEAFTCIISLNPPHLVCCLKATSNHTRKWFPKSFRFAVLWKMRKYFHYLESNSLGQWIFQYDINRLTFPPPSSWS